MDRRSFLAASGGLAAAAALPVATTAVPGPAAAAPGRREDVLDFLAAIGERPPPLERFILKLLYGLPLDDRPDSRIRAILNDRTILVDDAAGFAREAAFDLGDPGSPEARTVWGRALDVPGLIRMPRPVPGLRRLVGAGITERIAVREPPDFLVRETFNEAGFLRFLNRDCGDEGPRCNVRPEDPRGLPGMSPRTAVLRLGRRAGKSRLVDRVVAYETDRLLREGPPPSDSPHWPRSSAVVAISTGEFFGGRDGLPAFVRALRARWSGFGPFLFRGKSHARADFTARPDIRVGFHPQHTRAFRGMGVRCGILEEFGWFAPDHGGTDREIYCSLDPAIQAGKDPRDIGRQDGPVGGMLLVVGTSGRRSGTMRELERTIRDGDRAGLVLHLPSAWGHADPGYWRERWREWGDRSRRMDIRAEYV